MTFTNAQAAAIAVGVQLVSLLASFGLINSQEKGSIVSATTAVIALAFVVGAAIENHGKAIAAASPVSAVVAAKPS